jgi:hypothetical protein
VALWALGFVRASLRARNGGCGSGSSLSRIHEISVRKIGRYLQGTRDKGYFLNPNNTKNLDCYVDADFAGLWNPYEAQDPTTLKSRTGYVITFCGCPVLWASKLHT